jgi:hypothetical protein
MPECNNNTKRNNNNNKARMYEDLTAGFRLKICDRNKSGHLKSNDAPGCDYRHILGTVMINGATAQTGPWPPLRVS